MFDSLIDIGNFIFNKDNFYCINAYYDKRQKVFFFKIVDDPRINDDVLAFYPYINDPSEWIALSAKEIRKKLNK